MNSRSLPAAFVVVAVLLPAALAVAQPTPPLTPGSTFTIEFPDMPPTLAEMQDPKGIPATMAVSLPADYDPQRKHPLLVVLQGGNGGRGTSASIARQIIGPNEFVCVNLPLFKESLDPNAPANTPPLIIIRDVDGQFAWPLYQEMLARLEQVVPNLDPDRRVIGGFSNGAHMVGELIDQSGGEIPRRFSDFFMVEGGGRTRHYELLEGKRLLLMYGSAGAAARIQQMHDSAIAAGVDVTVHEMVGVGHAFPPEQYPAVRAWLGVPEPPAVQGTGAPTTQVSLQAGDKAPDLKLQASDGQEYDLSQFTGRKFVALCWFPRAGSEGAKLQCAALEAVMPNIPPDRVQVFGCSTAALDVTTTFARDGGYSFPVLSDFGGAVARAWGCLRDDGRSQRWTFLVDEAGTILAVNRNITAQTQGTELLKMLAEAGLVEADAAAMPTTPAGDRQITVQVGEQVRTCLLHLPPAYDGATQLPLVVALHGARGNGRGMAGTTGFNALADRYGFLAAYPDGIAADRSWNALFGTIPGGEGILADDVDDVAFLRALIASLSAAYPIDPARVYVCGHSAGAYMAYRAAIEMSDVVAAAGIVNGSLGIKSLDGVPCGATIPPPLAPVSVMHICGAQDGVVKFDGAQTPKNLYKSAPDCIQFFVEANGCDKPGQTTTDPGAGVTRTLYTGGRNGTEVELVIVENCNHNWPNAQQHGLSASQELWDFFVAHPKPAAPTTTPTDR